MDTVYVLAVALVGLCLTTWGVAVGLIDPEPVKILADLFMSVFQVAIVAALLFAIIAVLS